MNKHHFYSSINYPANLGLCYSGFEQPGPRLHLAESAFYAKIRWRADAMELYASRVILFK